MSFYLCDKKNIDTINATATASDIMSGKTAYVGRQKITGTLNPLNETYASHSAMYYFGNHLVFDKPTSQAKSTYFAARLVHIPFSSLGWKCQSNYTSSTIYSVSERTAAAFNGATVFNVTMDGYINVFYSSYGIDLTNIATVNFQALSTSKSNYSSYVLRAHTGFRKSSTPISVSNEGTDSLDIGTLKSFHSTSQSSYYWSLDVSSCSGVYYPAISVIHGGEMILSATFVPK